MLGELIAILATLTFVLSNVLFRKTEHEASPTYINMIRTAIGTLSFFLIAIIFNVFLQIFLLSWELWFVLIMSFVFGQVIGDTAYFKAQKDLGTTISLALAMTFPLFTFILSMIFLKQPFELTLLFSIFLIGSGVIIITKSRISVGYTPIIYEEISENTPIKLIKIEAIIFAILASLGWAIGAIIIDYGTNRINQILDIGTLSSVVSNVIRFPFTLLILISMVLRENFIYNRSNLQKQVKKSRQSWMWLIIASIIGTSIGAYLYTEAIRLAGASLMALIATASPLFALPLTYLINKEKISKKGFIGVILTILGVLIILIW
jgi:drug/metabolite transporter (DMT)-like permease